MLATILSRLIGHATTNPACPYGHRFTNGLRITITYYEKSHQFNLVLARDRVLPSAQEWKTVLDNWPYPARANPNTGDMDGRHYLAAMLPAHPKLL
ncbi:MAG: hypothetical protein D4R38_02670 [Dehalococcoidia bacterium]|nr:MAG: hypothetical protein D4R38_02670 [Dehalococcoidia bacterium]